MEACRSMDYLFLLFKRYAYLKCHTPDISYFDFLAMLCHISELFEYFQLFSFIGSGAFGK